MINKGIHRIYNAGFRAETGLFRQFHAGSFAKGWLLALVFFVAACGKPHPVADDPHVDLMIGASSPDGGSLVVDYDFSQAFEVYESTIVGGFVLWSGSDPGFGLVEFDEPDEGVYPLESGVEVTLVITALDPGVAFRFNGMTLNEVGDSVVLGSSPGLHGHGEWEVVLPEGTETGEYMLEFRLEADVIYDPSDPALARLVPVVEPPRARAAGMRIRSEKTLRSLSAAPAASFRMASA